MLIKSTDKALHTNIYIIIILLELLLEKEDEMINLFDSGLCLLKPKLTFIENILFPIDKNTLPIY